MTETDQALVQEIARTDGNHLPPHYYKKEVEKRFKREVSSATVTKALGSWPSRLQAQEPEMIGIAKKLLSACFYDKGLACSMVNKAMLTI